MMQTNSNRHQLLDQALNMSQRMVELGDAGEWDEVVELEPQRRVILEQAFATRAPIDEVLASRVRQILQLDKGLMEKSMKIRDEVAQELGHASKGRQAVNAYGNSAGL